MDAARYQQIADHFDCLMELGFEDRRAELERIGATDPALREELESLLDKDDSLPSYLKTPVMNDVIKHSGDPAAARYEDKHPPPQIGRYTIQRKLGAGGMGVVYLAEQDEPRRPVAVKIIRPSAMSRDLRRRFRQEAHVLGMLRHPGIAQVYEAGSATTDGRELAFFAMEYVEGTALNDYAAAKKLSYRDRLRTLAEVCDAVHHAHQKGIVHRDLKPGNILIDQAGQPKILDFGVARATDADINTLSIQTQVGQIVGTLPYMSPEQALGDSANVDTRCDVYALGVIAYELLADKLPLDVRRSSIVEAARIIREQEPTRLGNLNREFRGDVETIIAKALEKDRERRYGSAADMGADIRRYLNDEPIAARPASTIYQLRKFASRNRALVGGACATFVAVVAGLVVSVNLYIKADRARKAEQAQRKVAQTEADRANAINDFLLQDMLGAPDPWSQLGKDVTVATVLDSAVQRVDAAFENQPAMEAQVRATLGGSFMARGLYEDATRELAASVALYRRLGPAAADRMAAVLERYAEGLRLEGRLDEAKTNIEEALELTELRFGGFDRRTADALYTQGQVLRSTAEYPEAKAALERCVSIRRNQVSADPESLAKAIVGLGTTLYLQKRYSEAESVLQEGLSEISAIHGSDHPYVAQVQIDLAGIDLEEARYTQAATRLESACATLRTRLGEEHSETLSCLRSYAHAKGGMEVSAGG